MWGEKCVEKLNGIYAFAIWNDKTEKLFCARDRMGVKPFFFKQTETGIVFASELKALFKNPLCPAVLDAAGVNEIFLLAPGRMPGSGVYKDIKELLPGEFLWADGNGIERKKYFELTKKPHTESLKKTTRHLRKLVIDAIKRQLVADVPLATFLSGGLDSSIISHVAAKKYRKEKKILTTYSVDFKGNEENFIKSEFQPDTDTKYIKIMQKHTKSAHKFVILDNENVFEALEEAALARDLAGMGDVDSSLLLFAREVKKTHTVCLSGECADEIFGGYPWFFKAREEGTFPWARDLNVRKSLINPKFLCENPEKFIADLMGDDDMVKLNMKWFMQTLLDRKDRMTMYTGLEVRVPFCDHRVAEYAYNIPWEMLSLGGREKGLLRLAFKNILPHEIVYRKKAPYPKTFDPKFFELTRAAATKAVNNGGVLSKIINREYFNELLTKSPEAAVPWYGQLMRLPQLFAMLWQMDCIFTEYNVELKI
jgi:asparagine synthase (glutamine-hydrolysing)